MSYKSRSRSRTPDSGYRQYDRLSSILSRITKLKTGQNNESTPHIVGSPPKVTKKELNKLDKENVSQQTKLFNKQPAKSPQRYKFINDSVDKDSNKSVPRKKSESSNLSNSQSYKTLKTN
jgi:hypothetical protein